MAKSKYSKKIYDQTLAYIANTGKSSDYAISRFLGRANHTIKTWRNEHEEYQHMIDNADDIVSTKLSDQAYKNATTTRKQKTVHKEQVLDEETGKLVTKNQKVSTQDVMPSASDIKVANELKLKGQRKIVREAADKWRNKEIDALELETVYQEVGLKAPQSLEFAIQKEEASKKLKIARERIELENSKIDQFERMKKSGLSDEDSSFLLRQLFADNSNTD